MVPFRLLVKSKIQSEKFNEYLSLIPSLVELVDNSEPLTLQYEAYANEDSHAVSWIESYANISDFDSHFHNPKASDLKRTMAGFQEANMIIYFMFKPSESILSEISQAGISSIICQPWPGTIRLDEPRNEETNIQSFAIIELADLDPYRMISEQVEAAAEDYPGILFHRSYQIDDSRVAVLEEYLDSDTLINWAPVFAKNSGNFGSLVKSMTYDVFGNPSKNCREMLDGWGAVYFKKIAGFTRF